MSTPTLSRAAPPRRRLWIPLPRLSRGWLAVLSLVFVGVGLAFLGQSVSLPWLAPAWALWLLGWAGLLRRALPPLLGPVFVYDLIRSGRRGEVIRHRCLYAAILLIVLFSAYWSWFPSITPSQLFTQAPLGHWQKAAFAAYFSATFLGIQLVVVVLLTPLYTAGAIAEQKERRTLEFLLVTDLTDREIVLGSLAARLARLFLLILTGLPVLCALEMLGGIEPNLLIAGFVLSIMVAATLGAISTLCSVLSPTSLKAVATAYSTAILFIVPAPFVTVNIAAYLPAPVALIGIVTGLCCILGLIAYWTTLGAVLELRAFASPAQRSAAWTNSALDSQSESVRTSQAARVEGWGPFPEWEPLHPRPKPPGISLQRALDRPPVGVDALLWKEVYLEPGPGPSGLSIPALAAALGLVVLVGPALGWLSDLPSGGMSFAEYAQSWTRGVGITFTGILILLIAVNAAGRVSRERERCTLEGLLLLPVSSAEILFAKWLGSILSLRTLLVGMVAVWCAAVLTGGLDIVALPLLVAALAVYVAFFAALGLWLSTVCPTTLRAGLFTLLVTLVAVAGPGAAVSFASGGARLLPLPHDASDWAMLFMDYGLSPPATLWTLTFRFSDLMLAVDPSASFARIVAALAGLHCYLAAAALFWGLACSRLRGEAASARGSGPGGQ
jgi:ABC-type transport system involved in multi-copper enzyme maturation permease subunit